MWKLVSAGNSDHHPLLHSLNENAGRQTWEWDEDASREDRVQVEKLQQAFAHFRHVQKHSSDELLRMQSASKRRGAVTPSRVGKGKQPTDGQCKDSIRSALHFYEALQQDDGHWPGDYGGPMFLMPGMIIALYVTGSIDKVLSPRHKTEMIRYLRNHQNKDGGFGLHIEGPSTMFGTALRYTSMGSGLHTSASGLACQLVIMCVQLCEPEVAWHWARRGHHPAFQELGRLPIHM